MSLPKKQLKNYLTGFGLSMIFTLIAFIFVMNQQFHGHALYILIGILAALQLIVQLVFFLHIGQDRGPKWDNLAFYYTVFAVATVVVGSIWIMSNLHYNMDMDHTQQYEQKIIKDEIPNNKTMEMNHDMSSDHSGHKM